MPLRPISDPSGKTSKPILSVSGRAVPEFSKERIAGVRASRGVGDHAGAVEDTGDLHVLDELGTAMLQPRPGAIGRRFDGEHAAGHDAQLACGDRRRQPGHRPSLRGAKATPAWIRVVAGESRRQHINLALTFRRCLG
jgi:hypothetical protein